MNLLCTTFLFGVVTCSWQCFRFVRCLSVVVYIFQFLFFCASCSIFNVQNGIRSCAHRSCICSINIMNENTVLCSKSTSSTQQQSSEKYNEKKKITWNLLMNMLFNWSLLSLCLVWFLYVFRWVSYIHTLVGFAILRLRPIHSTFWCSAHSRTAL